MVDKFKFTDEEWDKLLDLGKNINEQNSFFPKDEHHHSDCSGKGPANTPIIRHGHEEIHRSVADALRKLDLPRSGFCSDATTRKFGNKFYKEPELEKPYDTNITWPSIMDNPIMKTPSTETNPKINHLQQYFFDQQKEINERPRINQEENQMTGFLKKWNSHFKLNNDINDNLDKPKELKNMPTSTNWMEVLKKSVEKQEPKEDNHLIPKTNLKSTYEAIQEHWTWKNQANQENQSWQVNFVPHSPSLEPVFKLKDSYFEHYDRCTKNFNDMVERKNAEIIASYEGLAYAERDALEKGLPKLKTTFQNLPLPPIDTGGWGK